MQDHGNFPAASHSVSIAFASLTDPKRVIASIKASCSQIQSIVLDLSLALAMALPRGLVRSVRAFEAPWSAVLFERTATGRHWHGDQLFGPCRRPSSLILILGGNGEPRQDEIWQQLVPHSERTVLMSTSSALDFGCPVPAGQPFSLGGLLALGAGFLGRRCAGGFALGTPFGGGFKRDQRPSSDLHLARGEPRSVFHFVITCPREIPWASQNCGIDIASVGVGSLAASSLPALDFLPLTSLGPSCFSTVCALCGRMFKQAK